MGQFCSLERLPLYLEHHQRHIKAFLKEKQIRKKFQLFNWPKSSVNPLENENILTILYSDIFVVLKLDFFSIEHHQHHIKAFLKEKQIWKKFQPFDQNHGLTGPLEKCKYFSYLIVTFLQSRKTSLLSRTSSNIIYLRLFSKEVLIWPKSWVNMFGSLRKCQHFVMWPPISPQNDFWELSEDLSLPRSG